MSPETESTQEVVSSEEGTVATEIVTAPEVSETRTQTRLLTEDIGADRSKVRALHEDFDNLHQSSHFVEWRTLTTVRAREAVAPMIQELGNLGFAWRDIARLVGVSVPAIQKWRRGEGASGESRARVASLLAACDLITEHYLIQDIASWFEVPLIVGIPVTPIDLYSAGRFDLLFDYAGQHCDPEQVLTEYDSGWRERYRTNFEVFRAADGDMAIRPKE